jgi:uncharacterized membrane protein YoaK (UPF0700 family)
MGIAILLYFWRPPELQKLFELLNPSSSIQYPVSSIQHPASDFGSLISIEFPILLFILGAIILTFFAIWKKFSLIPVLGLLTNFYLMAQLGITNWLRFLLWLAIGLVLFFSYGMRHSKLRNVTRDA